MTIVDVGTGPAVVLIPGIQGRWEWMKPAVDALAASCRVITFSLADEPGCGGRFDDQDGFASYVDQVRAALDMAGIEAATICGVSYGGLVAAAFAARHPDRTSHLVLVSAIPPSWRPDRRARFFLRAPRLLSPLFYLGSLRLYPEIAAAAGTRLGGLRAAARHGWNALTHPFSPSRMARRVRLLAPLHLLPELALMRRPTLIVTGEPGLDRVVPVGATREYARLWPHAGLVTLERTGHLGLITRPHAFASVVAHFVEASERGAPGLEMRRAG